MKRVNHFFASTVVFLSAALLSSEVSAQITLVKNLPVNSSKATGTSLAITLSTGGVAAGNSIIVSFAMDPATGTVSCTDTASNSYTLDRDQINGSGTSGVRTVILSAHNVATLATNNTITCTHPSVGSRALSASEFSGLLASGAKDQATSAPGSGTSPSSGNTATTTQADELLIGAIGVEGPIGDLFTPGASYTTGAESGTSGGNAATNITINPEYRIVSATNAYAATGTLGSSRQWAAAIVTYKGAPPPLPTKLVILDMGTPTAGFNFYANIQSQNAAGTPINVNTNTNVEITLKTGTGVLSGTRTGMIPAGSYATSIGPMTYTKAESGVVVTATVTSGLSLTPGDSAPFTVNPGSPSALTFLTQPGSSQVGSFLAGPPNVAVLDSFGNVVTSSTAAITMSIANPSYGVLSGTVTKNATAGVASFSDLTISPVANGYTLTATLPFVASVTSSAFNIGGATGTIAGTVSRADNSAPINGAVIEAIQAGVSMGTATSASNGSYSLSGLPTGLYELGASAAGYTAQPKSGITVTLGSTSTANFSLTPEKIVYVYDTLSRLRAVIDIAGQTAAYAYDAVGNLLGISRYSSSQTSVIDFTPTKGPVGTTPVTIYGTGFSLTPSQNTVTFNGTVATVISSAPTQLVVTVPSGATTGPIGVTSPSGSASSAASFTVTSSSGIPTVTSFSPTIGLVGTLVAVTGANFDVTPSKNDLRFNNARGAISTSTATSIATTVPSGTGSGRISVTTAYGKGTSSADFFIPPSPLTTADIGFTGRLSTNGTPLTVTISAANKQGLIVFDGVAGQRLSLRVTNDTFPLACTSCSDVILQFIRPDGSSWVSTSWANAIAHYFEPPPLPVSGTYTIQFKPDPSVGPGATGQATLEFFNITGEDQGTITPGIPVNVSVSTTGQNPKYSFNGTAGQRISLNATNSNFVMACPSCQAVYIYLYKPDGQQLTNLTWANAAGAFLDVQALPTSGIYNIVVDPQGNNTGHMTMTLYDVPPDNQGTITADGTPVVSSISTPGQKALRSFSGTLNQRVSLEATNSTLGCGTGYMQILKNDLTTVVANLDFCNGQYIDVLSLPENGTYWVLLDANGAATGQATLRLYTVVDVTGTIPGNGTPTVASITVPGQKVLLTFTGAANQVVSLEASNFNNDCAAVMSIVKPDGTPLASQFVCSGTPTIPPVISPVNGTYTVTYDLPGSLVGQATLQLYQWPSLTISYNGKIRDKVGQGDTALSSDGAMDGTFTVTVPSGGGTKTVNSLEMRNSVNGVWDTKPFNGYWALGAASTLNGSLLNNSDSSVNFSVKAGATFNVFGSDFNNSHFNSGTTFLIAVKFTDGSRAAGTLTIP